MTVLWDNSSKRYRGQGGRFIKRSAVLDELEKVRDGYKARVLALSQQLQRGEINLPAWTISMRDEIKSMHLTSAAVAKGGLKQMSPADRGRLGALTKQQYAYLNRFSRQVANGLPLNGKFLRRAQMYVDASRGTFFETERKMKKDAGFTEEINVLNAKESCAECSAEAGKGWVSIGTLSAVGSRICRTNCRCEIELRRAA
jgi:hypothetical protein